MNLVIASIVSVILLWPAVGTAALYRWLDEQGNLHITDVPPPPEIQERIASTTARPSQSAPPKKVKTRPRLSRLPHAQIQPPHDQEGSLPSIKGLQLELEGLRPHQATLTSPWQIFDGAQTNTTAPVFGWRDERGVDHVVDVLTAVPPAMGVMR